jgi:hypothetical protein
MSTVLLNLSREAELLPVGYFHLVFTLPGPIADIAYHNKTAIYDLLFTTAHRWLPLAAFAKVTTLFRRRSYEKVAPCGAV